MLFARVGASASRLYEADPTHHERMIGEFGIGVMSYFLVGEEFDVFTCAEASEPIGLRFSSRMIDEDIPADILPPQRGERGTTIVLHIRDMETFDGLVRKYPYWARNVDGLTAALINEGTVLNQGGLSHEILQIDIDLPDWIFQCTLGPPVTVDAWYSFDGKGHVDVLYSGVFVERLEIEHLWGVEGSILVDPKKFRPKLNREGFVGDKLRTELQPFLRRAHPAALEKAADIIATTLRDIEGKSWTINRLATLWLAIPRGGEYAAAAKKWDDEFRKRPILRQLLANGADRNVSVDDLVASNYDVIYLAPTNWANQAAMLRAAVRLLRDGGKAVIVGVERDSGYLSFASFSFASTETIVVNQFASELPRLLTVASVADQVLRQESLVDVLLNPVPVRIVQIGPEASALLIAGSEIWINTSMEGGKAIARHICDNPYGLSSLISACLTHAPDQIQGVANLFRGQHEDSFYVGPIRRQAIRLRVK